METERHKNTHWLYTSLFHFFDIPHFIPKDLLKKFLDEWDELFKKRDEFDETCEEKDALLVTLGENCDALKNDLQDILDWQNSYNWLT